jgi:hypothetical protein
MEIEFDPVKDRINLEKHGVGLDAASLIFATHLPNGSVRVWGMAKFGTSRSVCWMASNSPVYLPCATMSRGSYL